MVTIGPGKVKIQVFEHWQCKMQFRTALNLGLHVFKLIRTPLKVIKWTYKPPRTVEDTRKHDPSLLNYQNWTGERIFHSSKYYVT